MQRAGPRPPWSPRRSLHWPKELSRAMILHRLLRVDGGLLVDRRRRGRRGDGRCWPGPSRRRSPSRPHRRRRGRQPISASRSRTARRSRWSRVSTVPTGPNTWWKPDGSPLAEAPVDTIESQPRAPTNRDAARVILVRTSGVQKDDMFRWLPTRTDSYWGGRPTKDGGTAPELDYYEATFGRDRADCGVQVRLAAGPVEDRGVERRQGGRRHVRQRPQVRLRQGPRLSRRTADR